MNNILVQFVTDNALGVLRIGLPAKEVVAFLGRTSERYRIGNTHDEVWRYGPLGITIIGDRLSGLQVGILERTSLPAPLGEYTLPQPDMTAYDYIDILDDQKIEWQVDSDYTYDRQLCISSEGGVRAFFDLEHREFQSLQLWSAEKGQ